MDREVKNEFYAYVIKIYTTTTTTRPDNDF